MDNSIYKAWDNEFTTNVGGVAFVMFAASFLEIKSKMTHLPLNAEQSKILIDIIDSFVDDAHERHLRNLGDAEPERAAGRELSEEIKSPLFTRDEIAAAMTSGKEEFATMSPEEIRDRLKAENGLFAKFKRLFLTQCGKDFGDMLGQYLDKDELARAKEIFSTPVEVDEYKKLKETLDDTDFRDNHANLADVQAQMTHGVLAKEIQSIVEEKDTATDAETPKCLADGFSGRLLSKAEKLLRKLTAVEFLLARMAFGDDEEAALPFIAIGAARCAYDWVTERKATLQLVELGSALKELDPLSYDNDEGEEVSK